MAISASPALRSLLENTLTTARMRGIVVVAARAGQLPDRVVIGADAGGRPLAADSLFSVASVTKLATALAVLRLVDRGELGLDSPLARNVPEAAAAADSAVTLRRLLSHTAGLPLDVPPDKAPYGPGLSWPILAAACLETPLAAAPCTQVQYSNVGYGLLALVVERVVGQSFPDAIDSLVLSPLGMEGYLGTEPPRPPVVLDGVRGPQAGTPLEPFNSPFWRSLALPWAGLVTTPDGALALLRAFSEPPAGFLNPATAAEATHNQAGALSGGFIAPMIWSHCPWGLGPELRDEKAPHWAPAEAGPDSFGHSGASGCVAWASPQAGVAWAILGSRTADSGWLLRRGPDLGAAILEAYA